MNFIGYIKVAIENWRLLLTLTLIVGGLYTIFDDSLTVDGCAGSSTAPRIKLQEMTDKQPPVLNSAPKNSDDHRDRGPTQS